MNCADAREWFSAYLDEALDAGERNGIEGHLAGCGECRRELERFRQTLALLHRVERPRAPVGFVDRVLAAAAPVPWYGRALRGLFFPLRVKLPLEAAVLVLLSIGAVYLYERTPEMEHAAREPAPQLAPRPEAPATPPVDSMAESARAKAAAPRRQLEQDKDRAARDGKLASVPRVPPSEEPVTAPPASKPAPAVSLEAKKEAAAENLAAPRAAERLLGGGPVLHRQAPAHRGLGDGALADGPRRRGGWGRALALLAGAVAAAIEQIGSGLGGRAWGLALGGPRRRQVLDRGFLLGLEAHAGRGL